MFVDLAGYTAASWMHGDDTAADLSIRLLELAIGSCDDGDEVVKSIGDAVMCCSPDPIASLGFVTRLWTRADVEPNFPQFRGALHHGRAVRYRGDYFGTAVNIAARLAALAAADEILATPPVAAVAFGPGWRVEPLGEQQLRNIGEPVNVERLSFFDRVPNPVDPVCHMRVDTGVALSIAGDEGPIFFCSADCRDLYAAVRVT